MPEQNSSLIQRALSPMLARLGFVEKSKAIATQAQNGFLPSAGFTDYTATKLGMAKPTKVSFDYLRKIAQYDAIIGICIRSVKKSVSQSGWRIVPREGYAKNEKQIKEARNLFTFVNSSGENLRLLLDRIVDDLLTLDAAVVEKVYNAKGQLIELNSVDGATIRPRFDEYGDYDKEFAFAQVIGNKTVAEFARSEIIYMMQNPQNDIKKYGYGMSPIESILLMVQASLNADLHNASIFSEDNIPPGILDLGDMTEAEAKKFIREWNATVIGNTNRMKFVYGATQGQRFVPLKTSNKDMQYVEYVDWLSRLKVSTFGLSSMDINIMQDVNRATAEVQASLSQSKGVRTVKRLIEDYFNREILLASEYDEVEFKFDDYVTVEERKKQAEVDKIYVEAGIQSGREVAEREGFSTEHIDEMEAFNEDEAAAGMGTDPTNDGKIDGANDDNANANSPTKSVEKERKNTKHWQPLY